MRFVIFTAIGIFGLALLFPVTTPLHGQNQSNATNLPNTQPLLIPQTPPREALKMLSLPSGFQATLFAAEPDINQPIAMTTDARGRLWVAECNTYSDRGENFNTELNDRILILEDTNADGTFDKKTVFWDQAKKLTSIEVGFGGVWLTAAPNLLFIPDANQDDIPDGEPVVLLDGFEGDVIRHNIVNGLRWGPDGWLYGRHGIQA
ncbi:MAG: PVC-type heme-binding CxxCH protein, partial [Mariniblastus sp.]